jgi:glucose-6-phosphate 1-epimerase
MQTLPDGVRLERGSGGLERLAVETSSGAAHVYLHGAHVTHFQPAGARPVLWVSRQSHFEGGRPGKPIRGGVPICFPWFGPKTGAPASPSAPAHGVARLLAWTLAGAELDSRGRVQITLRLDSDDFTRSLYPHDFAATFRVTVGAELSMELTVRNTGAAPMTCEEALHSYFAVSDARRIGVLGLEGAAYLDKVEAFARKRGEAGPIAIAGETDRVYPRALGTVTIEDPGWQRRIAVHKSGSATTVVWNPWVAKARAMADFGDEEWPDMVCVESANVGDDALTLAPGGSHVLTATIAAAQTDPTRGSART